MNDFFFSSTAVSIMRGGCHRGSVVVVVVCRSCCFVMIVVVGTTTARRQPVLLRRGKHKGISGLGVLGHAHQVFCRSGARSYGLARNQAVVHQHAVLLLLLLLLWRLLMARITAAPRSVTSRHGAGVGAAAATGGATYSTRLFVLSQVQCNWKMEGITLLTRIDDGRYSFATY